jgi:hypothetical protein
MTGGGYLPLLAILTFNDEAEQYLRAAGRRESIRS